MRVPGCTVGDRAVTGGRKATRFFLRGAGASARSWRLCARVAAARARHGAHTLPGACAGALQRAHAGAGVSYASALASASARDRGHAPWLLTRRSAAIPRERPSSTSGTPTTAAKGKTGGRDG
jgi:hypothetical protein